MPGVGDEEVTGRIERETAGRVHEPGAQHGAHARGDHRRGPAGGRVRDRHRDQRDQSRDGREESVHGQIMPVAGAAGSGGAP